jgi:hypothetical protein
MTKITLPAPARCVAALLATVPPPPPLPPLLVGREDDADSTNGNSSPAVLAHAVCQVLKAHRSLDRPLPACPVGGKDSKGNGGDNNGNADSNCQEVDRSPDRDGPPLPPLSGGAIAMRVAGK